MEIFQYIKRGNKRVGVILARKCENESPDVYIGWSLCNKADNFDRELAIKIATERAGFSQFNKYWNQSQRQLGKIPLSKSDVVSFDYNAEAPVLPHSVEAELDDFVNRAKRYFKTDKVYLPAKLGLQGA